MEWIFTSAAILILGAGLMVLAMGCKKVPTKARRGGEMAL